MLKAFRRLPQLRMHPNPLAWLTVVTKTTLIDFWRHARKRPDWVSLSGPVLNVPARITIDPTDDWIDPLHWIAPHIDDLPDWAGGVIRTGIKLGTFEPAVIASELSRSEGGVRSAIDKIRDLVLDSFVWGEWIRSVDGHVNISTLRPACEPGADSEAMTAYSKWNQETRERLWSNRHRLLKVEYRALWTTRELSDVAAFNVAIITTGRNKNLTVVYQDHISHLAWLQARWDRFTPLLSTREFDLLVRWPAMRYESRIRFIRRQFSSVIGTHNQSTPESPESGELTASCNG
jgi:hypothetical protein